jgi:alpha-beta hydrolase superfamily lysophospholipase
MKKMILLILKILLIIYITICGLLYFFQEKLIFLPEKLDKNFEFAFIREFEEINVKTKDNTILNGLLFKADNSKGLIFYLHGNAGSVRTWGEVAKTYTDLNYDVFMLDYRGYGKSEGKITNEELLYQDLQTVYDELTSKYDESKIIVLGYSIGTGMAAKIASVNNPKLLILQAPYYSLTDLMKHTLPIIPTFILKYKFETNKFITDCKMPVIIFHGNQDEVIYYNSSVKLKGLMKKSDSLITLNGQGHNGMTENIEYRTAVQEILKKHDKN